jgi:hypothetical protein
MDKGQIFKVLLLLIENANFLSGSITNPAIHLLCSGKLILEEILVENERFSSKTYIYTSVETCTEHQFCVIHIWNDF